MGNSEEFCFWSHITKKIKDVGHFRIGAAHIFTFRVSGQGKDTQFPRKTENIKDKIF